MKVLVIGSNGLVGSPFPKLLGENHIYHTRKDVDLTDEKLTKEFNKASSLLSNQDAITVGITKYLKGNNLKVQSSVSTRNNEQFNTTINANEKVKTLTAQFSVQLVF